MQLLKNRRGYSYRCGYLKVPEKYAYLKNKAAKETQDGCDALSGGEEDGTRGEAGGSTDGIPPGSKSKRATPVAATTQPWKKQKTSLNVTTTCTRPTVPAKGKVKQKTIELDDEDDDDGDEDGEVDDEGGLEE